MRYLKSLPQRRFGSLYEATAHGYLSRHTDDMLLNHPNEKALYPLGEFCEVT